MSISVAPDAGDLAGDLADRFVVVVTGANDTDAALAGLGAARPRLARLGPSVLSPVVLSPDGPLLRVAELEAGDREVERVPDLVAKALAEAGVATATVEIREPVGPLDRLDRTGRAAVLRCFPTPAGDDGVLPAAWLEVAAEWVLGGVPPGERVDLRLLGAPFRVRAADAPAAFHAAAGARTWCDVVQGALNDRIRTASLTFGHTPHLALAAGGPRCDVAALLARYDLLCDVARDLSPGAAYACVDLEPTFEHVGLGLPGTGWPSDGGAPPNAVAGLVVDVAVPDVHPFQLLGPGHAERLAVRRRRRRLGRPRADGGLEVELGQPIDWLPEYDTRDEVVASARKDLREVLVTEAELDQLMAARRPAAGRAASAASHHGPDLAHVVLDALPHARRGLRLTVLELAAWLGNEPHSDAPASVSPVLAGYARWLASGLDDGTRQALVPYARQLAGTRAPGLRRGPWRPLAPEDERRALLAADWLARTQAPAWLRAAGLDRAAAALEKVRPTRRGTPAPRLVAALGDAVDALVALDQRLDDRAWEAWERASEATGWVAASEAAWTGVPEVLAAATELRVIELAREPLVRDGAIGDAIRAAAVAAAADAAWRGAAQAAAAAVDAAAADPPAAADPLVTVSLADAVGRSVQGVATRLGVDRDTVEQDLEVADRAALDALAELVRAGRTTEAPLDVARAAAAASAGGTAWSAVQELVRGAVGEPAWDAGMTAGRTAAARVVHHASAFVDRAVLVALAREASGLAGRVAAARGRAAFDPVVGELRPKAIALLDELLAVD